MSWTTSSAIPGLRTAQAMASAERVEERGAIGQGRAHGLERDAKDVRDGLANAFGPVGLANKTGMPEGVDCTELQSSETSPGSAARTTSGTAGNQMESPATLGESRGRMMVGETGFEPATPWSRRAECRSARRGTGSPGVVSLRQH